MYQGNLTFYKVHRKKDFLLRNYNFDFCTYKTNAEAIDRHNRGHLNFLDTTFPGLIQQCPYTSIKVVDGIRRGHAYYWPNGTYKTVLRLFNKEDENIFELTYVEDLLSEV